MSFFWKKEYSLGIDIIDEQHKKFVEIVNRFNDTVDIPKSKDLISGMFEEVLEHIKFHFKTEEDYFDKFHYKNAKIHKKYHDKFIKEIQDLKKENIENKIKVTHKLVKHLIDWLLIHLDKEDKKYVKCFKENGLK
ncbi:MAG: bacteriohemerythrin [Candidatus Magasanikbacteria bacterium]|nr:bacteriohemerythrin [Candidatus Magasanikbacteria bacterium]